MTLNVEAGVTAQNFTLRVEHSSSSTDRTVILNNNGTIENAKIHGHANANAIFANNKGTIKNSEFANANVTNEQGATIEDSSLVRAGDSRSLLTNLGTVKNCAFFGAYFMDDEYGTITNCVAWGDNEFPEGVQAAEITIDGDARWTITDPRMPDRLATDKFYIVGSPTLKIQIWDDVKRTIVPLSNIDGDTNGITTVEEDGETWYQFTPDSTNKESIVLNVLDEHQLTVTGGGVIKAINGTDTTGSPTTKQVKETLKVTLEAPEQDGKTFKEWKVTAGTAPTNFVYKRNEYYNLIDNPTSFYMPEGDVTLEAIYYNEALVIGEDGKPVTEGREPYGADGKGVQGDGWTYDGTTLKLNPTEAKTFDLSYNGTFLKCKLEVGEKATVKGWISLSRGVINNGTIDGPDFHKESYEYPPKLTNNGTVKNCYVDYGYVTNNGIMENVSFVICERLTNNAGATIKNAVVRTDGRNMAYNNSGTIKNAVFEFKPSGETVHVLKTEEDGKNPSASVEGCSYGVSASQVYIIGEPVLKARIYDTVNRTYVTITNVNGNTSYGGLTANKDQNNYQKFTVQSEDTELVLNQGATVTKYTLTLTDATADPAKTEYEKGDEITLTAKDAAEGKQFDEWELTGLTLKENHYFADTTIVVTITGNATAKATYKNKTYKLTLETDGTENAGIFYRHNGYLIGNDSAFLAKDDTAELQADVPEGKQFDKWELSEGLTLVDGYKLTDATIKIKMPGKEATAKAFFKDKAPTTYTLTVEGGQTATGETSKELKEGKEVAVDANVPDDKVFTGWTVSDGATLTHNGEQVDLSENHLVFNMPAKTFTLTANFETARTNILFNEDGTLNLYGVKDYEGDGWYYSEGALYLNPATATEYDFAHVDPQNKDSAKLEAVNVPIHVVNSKVTIAGGTFKAEVESTVTNANFKNCVFNGEVDIQTICNVDNCIFTKSCTITDLYGEQNCLFEKEPGESIVTYELTEASGATVTATLDGCEGEVSGTTLYFSGTPTLKVKVADGIVEKANDKDVGKADANGWYTVTAKTVMAEDDEQIVLTKGTSTPDPVDPNPTPNPDDQPKTYTVTVKGGKINNKTEEKVQKGTELTVDVDEKEVPEGMTFDVWSISFPEGVKDTLTGNPSVNLHDPHMTFTMPEADITIEAQYRSSELPGEDDGPSALGTMATVAVGGAAAGILVWQGVSLGVDSYLQLNLPQGVDVPTNRRELVVLLWETAGKPETALPSLYSDVPAEEIELQKATRWAIDNGLVKPADDNDASRFDPDRYVTKYDVFGAWLKLKKLMK